MRTGSRYEKRQVLREPPMNHHKILYVSLYSYNSEDGNTDSNNHHHSPQHTAQPRPPP